MLLREHGASSAEYAGIIFAAVSLVLALVLVAPQWGETLVCKIGSEISSIGGGSGYSCDGGLQADDSHVPDYECVTSSHEGTLSARVTVGLTFAAEGAIKIEEFSDGTYRITDSRKGTISAGVGEGGGIKVEVDGEAYGVYADASASIGGTGEGGAIYNVDSAEEKDQLVSYLQRDLAADAVGSNPITNFVAHGVNDLYTDLVKDYSVPAPTEIYAELGGTGSASAEATRFNTGANAEAEINAAYGVRLNTETGESTYYYKVDASASAGATDTDFDVDASGSGELYVAVTYDADGESITGVQTTAAYDVSGSGDVDAGPFGQYSDSNGKAQIYQASLDLSNGEVQEAATEFLESAGIPVPGSSSESSNSSSVSDAFSDFVEVAQNNGVITKQDFESEDGGVDVEVALSEVIGVGFGGGYTTEDVEYSNGQYWDGSSWQDWTDCQ